MENDQRFAGRILKKLWGLAAETELFPQGAALNRESSAVLFLLGPSCFTAGKREPCIIFNKRSRLVRQPGDLCFPGGSIAPRMDRAISALLHMPLTPLAKWPYWHQWRKIHPNQSRRLAILLATSLRESFEEMRLNPLGVQFLGPMPAYRLTMFNRSIFPMVGWVKRQRRFYPNWEVDKIVRIPVSQLLNPANYALFRLRMVSRKNPDYPPSIREMPCFRHDGRGDGDLLWGATFRMVMSFLDLMFDFAPPDIQRLPVVHRTIDESYSAPKRPGRPTA